MTDKNLIIINNEKISKKLNNFYCENIDLKSIPEDLNESFNVTVIARSSKTDQKRKININNIETASNIIKFLFNIYKTFKKKNATYLIISITPYTFFSYILLFFFKKRIHVYLRSNGYEEYKAIFGSIGPIIYYLMFITVTFKSNIITCQKKLFTKRKCNIVFPSEVSSIWLNGTNKPLLDKPRILYIGRLKIEKGIFSLTKILNEAEIDFELSIVGDGDNKFNYQDIKNKKIIFHPSQNDTNSLIKFYDNSNIFILPSYTEAHPKVVDEALARLRPIVIFKEIHHIINNRKGIFTASRELKSLLQTIEYIIKNYSFVQKEISENKLPTKKKFISDMVNALNQDL
jgi:glycosyltransferase involved in cell wall biosynthesis